MNFYDKITSFNIRDLSNLNSNQVLHMIIYMFLVSYVVSIQPKLPNFIEGLFKHTLFRLICISYILWRANDNIQLSILLTFSFLIIVHYTNKNHILEGWNSHTEQNYQKMVLAERNERNERKRQEYIENQRNLKNQKKNLKENPK